MLCRSRANNRKENEYDNRTIQIRHSYISNCYNGIIRGSYIIVPALCRGSFFHDLYRFKNKRTNESILFRFILNFKIPCIVSKQNWCGRR